MVSRYFPLFDRNKKSVYAGEIEKRNEEKVSSDKKCYLYSLKYFIGKHN